MPTGIPKNGVNKGWFKKEMHPATEFKKGHNSWNKGTHIQTNTGRTHFKKGQPNVFIPKGSERKKREKSCNWKGGTTIGVDGRIFVYQPEHPNAIQAGYVRRSRLVMEKEIGRLLTREEVVHHDRDVSDDSIENLILFSSQSEHLKFHRLLNK